MKIQCAHFTDDDFCESDEAFTVRVEGTSAGVVVLNPVNATIAFLDNDGKFPFN